LTEKSKRHPSFRAASGTESGKACYRADGLLMGKATLFCRVVQLVAHQILDLGVLGSSPSAAALPLICWADMDANTLTDAFE
jgi:hypothetical protein